MDVAVCDDEEIVRRQLITLLASEPDVETESFSDAEGLLASDKRYALCFLDIRLPGIGGVEAAKRLLKRDATTCVVFVTGAKEYVFDAFDMGAMQHLLKPVEEAKLREVVERARRERMRFDMLREEKLFIRTRQGAFTFPKDRILYVEAQLKKLVVHTKWEAVACYGRLGELEKRMGTAFYRCHRGYLVNMAHIVGYDSSSVALTNGERICLAKERYADFVKSYLRYLQNGGVSFV